MTVRLVLATRNAHKLREFERLLPGIELVPLPDGVVLWTRLAPQPLTGGGMPMVPVTVQWELASDAASGPARRQ